MILILTTSASMSTEINLNFDFNVDGKEFKKNEVYTNTNGIKFKVTRFEYYMCGFELNEKPLNLYLLVDGDYPNYSLGDNDINELSKIGMSFGVKIEDNIGKDPNMYSPFHALGPKDPSMHWGWNAGYRFWAIEGLSDPDGDGQFDKSFQYHILGDESFRSLSFDLNAIKTDGAINVEIDFNLQKLLAPIDMTQFGIFHDFYNNSKEIRDLVDNIIPSGAISIKSTSSVESNENNIELYPNPTTNYLKVGQEYLNSNYSIIALDGNLVQAGTINNSQINLENLISGTYLIRISDSKGKINMAKFVKK
ncbi:MAG: hypothetical protein CVV25_03900 [Ignavibacteriae bacterium HGW-Ignavibacteriae-4]|nr:MAG: hypothetical protein CVV25_03900 [Ignavibacteriae bacterium HGW-Ignavibacteriae-4]